MEKRSHKRPRYFIRPNTPTISLLPSGNAHAVHLSLFMYKNQTKPNKQEAPHLMSLLSLQYLQLAFTPSPPAVSRCWVNSLLCRTSPPIVEWYWLIELLLLRLKHKKHLSSTNKVSWRRASLSHVIRYFIDYQRLWVLYISPLCCP